MKDTNPVFYLPILSVRADKHGCHVNTIFSNKKSKLLWKKKEITFKKPVDIYLLIGTELTEKYNWMVLVQISGDVENVDISVKMETWDNLSTYTCGS